MRPGSGVLLWKYHNAAQHVVQPVNKGKGRDKQRSAVDISKA